MNFKEVSISHSLKTLLLQTDLLANLIQIKQISFFSVDANLAHLICLFHKLVSAIALLFTRRCLGKVPIVYYLKFN